MGLRLKRPFPESGLMCSISESSSYRALHISFLGLHTSELPLRCKNMEVDSNSLQLASRLLDFALRTCSCNVSLPGLLYLQ